MPLTELCVGGVLAHCAPTRMREATLKYLVPENKIQAIYKYRSQRVLDLIKEHDLDFLYVWDYGNTRYAFDVMPRFHYESDNCFGYMMRFKFKCLHIWLKKSVSWRLIVLTVQGKTLG